MCKIGDTINPNVHLIPKRDTSTQKGYFFSRNLKMKSKIPTTIYELKKLTTTQNSQCISNISDNDSKIHKAAITNDAKWSYFTPWTALISGKNLFTKLKVFLSSSPCLRNTSFILCANFPTTSGFKSIVPKPVPTSKPNIWKNIAICFSFISSAHLGVFFRIIPRMSVLVIVP